MVDRRFPRHREIESTIQTPCEDRIREVLEIQLPRPRGLHVREHPRFVEYVGRIRDLIFTKA